MLSISSVSDADYYLRTSGAGCGGGGAAYYVDGGEPPGRWLFPFANDLGVSGEIVAGAQSGEYFARVLNHLCHPIHLHQLGRAPQKFLTAEEKLAKWQRKNPEATPEEIREKKIKFEEHNAHAVHAWDMTFSVVKSISVWHAALEHQGQQLEAEAQKLEDEDGSAEQVAELREEAEARKRDAEEIVAAMGVGIDAAMGMAALEFGVTRRGAAGPDIDGKTTMRHVHNPDLQCAIFTHHTSRERDPQLHAHVMVLNRILCEDEQWRALFASGLLKSKHQLDAVFTRVMEAELTRRLGARFVMRPDGKAREVVGVSQEVRDLFSARSRALGEKADQMLRDWAAEHEIDNIEDVPALKQWQIKQLAVKESRRKKPTNPPPRAEEVQRWDAEIAALCHEGFVGVLDEVDQASRTPPGNPEFDPEAVIAAAVAQLTEKKGTFNRSHLMFAISQHLPDMPGLSGTEVVALLRDLTAAAEKGKEVVSLAAPARVKLPASLIDDRTGESVFEPPNGGRFSTLTHIGREDWLVKLLGWRGAPALTSVSAAEALADRGLSDEQRQVLIDVLTSDRFVEVIDAAAGTGKSRVMAALSDVSTDLWGHGLTGFTASQNAAEVLAREGVHRAYNIAAFLTHRKRVREGKATDLERARFAIPEGATMVVDESSMVSTPDAVALFKEFIELGAGRVVFIGDTAQVDAVDAGGGFALMAHHRTPHTLTQVRRFAHEWERKATTALRDGDLEAGLAPYEVRGRIRGGGEPEEVEREAVATVVEDIRLGYETVLVVSTTKKADKLSSHIRERLVRAGRVRADGVEVSGDNVAGVGDIVQTRHNDRRLDVVNREVWRVDEVDLEAGTIRVSRAELDDQDRRVWGASRDLPAEYVREYVELAYATTVEAVQGRTVDAGHLLVDEMMGRSRAYPGVTRGGERNTMWVPIERPPRRHRESDEDYERRIPSRMSAVVAAFEREDHTQAARMIIEAEQARAENLGHLGPQWQQLIAEAREADHRHLLREVLGTDAGPLFSDPSVEGVLNLMRSAEAVGYDVPTELRRAYGQHRIANARTPAGMLYALLERHLRRRDVQPRVQVERAATYEERVPPGEGEIEVARETGKLMDERVGVLGEQAEVQPPAWAVALLGGVPADIVARTDWREKVGIVAGYREQYGWRNEIDPIGPAPSRAEPEKRWAWLRASRALGEQPERETATASDYQLAERVMAWHREQEAMPRNVDEDLRDANDAAAYARAQIVACQDRGEDATEWRRLHQEYEARARRLDRLDGTRKAELVRTTPVRVRARDAVVEMRTRVERDRVVADRAESKYLRAEREREQQRREAEDRDTRIHVAVAQRWQAQYVPDREVPAFGSPRWHELDDDAPEKRFSLFLGALSYWRMGNPRSPEELRDRLDRVEAELVAPRWDGIVEFREPTPVDQRADDDAPDMPARVTRWQGEREEPERRLGPRGRKEVREGLDEREALAREPSGEPEVLAAVHRYTWPLLRDREGVPEIGTERYADADDDTRAASEAAAALRWYNTGDDLDRQAERVEAGEDKLSAVDISKTMQERRRAGVDTRSWAEIKAARGEEPPERTAEKVEAEIREARGEQLPARPDTSWVREAQRAVEPERTEPARQEPAREPAPARQETDERDTKPREPRMVPPAASTRDDDLAEQEARARHAEERSRAADEAREAREAREADQDRERHDRERYEPAPTRDTEDVQR